MLSGLLRLLRLANQLSIDVAAGAAISCLFFAQLFNIHLRLFPVIILLIAVWSIYAADHLLDAHRIGIDQLTWRRRLYFTHFRQILFFLISALLVALILTFFLYERVILGGAALSLLVVLYFVFKDRMPGFRELFCALLYCAGVLLAPLLNMTGPITPYDAILVAQFVLTVVSNLLLFSLFDYENDQAENQVSFATHFGRQKTCQIIIATFALQFLFCTISILAFQGITLALTIILSMNAVLIGLFLFRSNIQHSNTYRQIADGIFLFPLVYLLS